MSENTVTNGQVVSMEYTLWVGGEVLDTSDGQGPLQFLAGYGNIIPGLEQEMMGMKIGDEKEVTVAPADGYGEYDEAAFMDVPRKEFPDDMSIEEGLELSVSGDDGQAHYARIDEVGDDSVRLDFNHPLAGQELKFKVKVVALRAPTEEEVEHGHVHEAGHHH
ncbi:MAG: peptidylprolyl isomerase [Chloroflexi bacterium]|nr:peptidylprolyl isomerase [Chloroflexota bacterium]